MPTWIISVMLASMAAESRVELIAHRGESADAPENTMAAFKLAWERRVAAIELDVHLTRDGKLIVCHDADTKRTGGIKKIVKDCASSELTQLDVGQWKDARFAGETMPLLDDVLAQLPGGTRCFIEIKVGPEAVPALVTAVGQCGKPLEQLVVISFKAETVAEAKRRLPELKAYYLAEFKQELLSGRWQPSVEELIDEARRIRADGLNVSFKGPVDAGFVRRVKQAGLEFFVWTVDEVEVARRLVDAGVDGITTNKAAWMKEALAK
jgi:glycerophosphoryl diester phosphodiesterase